MNEIDKYLVEFENLLEGVKYKQSNNELEISFSKPNLKLRLNGRALNRLLKGELIDRIPQFKYYSHYGFSFDNYGEFFIGNDSSFLYELYGHNTYIDLNFKISSTFIEINTVSTLCKLLLESYYSKHLDYIADRGLEEYFYTIKIYDTPIKQHKESFIKALYYLNSHYLQRTGNSVSIYQVLPEDYDILIEESEYDNVVNVEIKRTRTRKDFISIEPIILFNHASTQNKENCFLSFYRILEFFFYRALENELKKLRFDSNVAEKTIIQTIQKKDERNLLFTLLSNTLTDAEKRNIVSFLLHKSIIDKNTFTCLCNRLYDYRNSLVHSKEYQINSTQLPDLFNERKEYEIWNYVIRNIARICISRLNTKK